MHQTVSATKDQVRQMIYLRAREMSRQITEAAEDMGERCAERRRTGSDGIQMSVSMPTTSMDCQAN